MPDNLTPQQRSYCMSRIKGKDTVPEMLVRSALHKRGLRFRKHVKDLPGKPDIVFKKARVAVFVDGDFWHGYDFGHWESRLSEFWKKKIVSNQERDACNDRRLREMDWVTVRIWQHEIEEDFEGCINSICSVIKRRTF